VSVPIVTRSARCRSGSVTAMPTPTPKMERRSIEGQRSMGIFWMIFAGMAAALTIGMIVSMPDRVWSWLYILVPLIGVVNGTFLLRRSRRRLAAFTSENGPDAGRQTRVT
jgi:F0F1-type ATP synthase assembly protein I